MAESGNSPSSIECLPQDPTIYHVGHPGLQLFTDNPKAMDLIPPSYQSATDRDAWAIIARYVPSSDLRSASLVCRRWHNLFMPFLWGDPASHFGTENDAVYGRFLCNAFLFDPQPRAD